MIDAPLMLGVSGLRGIVGASLTAEVAARYASAFGAWLSRRVGCAPSVIVARDGRAGGESITNAAVSGLLASGCRVCVIGVATTPTTGVMVDEAGADGAMIVTASHNPAEWNGLKVLIRAGGGAAREVDASAPPASAAGEIVREFQAGTAHGPMRSGATGGAREDAASVHVEAVLRAARACLGVEDFWRFIGERRALRVLVDAVNASGAAVDREFFAGSSCRFVQLAGDGSGVFPHPPEPTRENLRGLSASVRAQGADVGFAQDPDADRLAIVDERGEYIGEEYTLAIAAECLLSATDRGRDRVVVANLSTSRMIDDIARGHGARVVRTPVGEANVAEAMRRLAGEGADVVVGGEGNGGVIWPRVTLVRDSISSMALVLLAMAREGLSVSGLVDRIHARSPGGRGYAIEKRKVDLPSKELAVPAVESIARAYASHLIDRQDGVRVDFTRGPRTGRAWLHVRASNTEPIMRLIAEAPSADEARAVLDEASEVIARR